MSTSRVLVKSAKGMRGEIIRLYGGEYCFRVYNGAEFTDYDLLHTELSVVIEDDDAYIYEENILDHSPETLGYERTN